MVEVGTSQGQQNSHIPAITGAEGAVLAYATLDMTGGSVMRVERMLQGTGRLLQYYFGQGKREVWVTVGDLRLAGRLRTSLKGTVRSWEISLTPLAEAGAPAAAEIAAQRVLAS